jgi:REP element-mobilizing transposase RayT
MQKFNTREPIGSLYENSFVKEKGVKPKPLVSFLAYCINPNHYHFILTPVVDKGIECFMQRLGTGYTMYFNEKYHRSGSLFQGKFKASHIDKNEYLLHVSVYVNLNNRVHQLGGKASKLVRSSWNEYFSTFPQEKICEKDIVIDQFKTIKDYGDFAFSSLENIIERKQKEKDLQILLID